jgi:hypothetical protein
MGSGAGLRDNATEARPFSPVALELHLTPVSTAEKESGDRGKALQLYVKTSPKAAKFLLDRQLLAPLRLKSVPKIVISSTITRILQVVAEENAVWLHFRVLAAIL